MVAVHSTRPARKASGKCGFLGIEKITCRNPRSCQQRIPVRGASGVLKQLYRPRVWKQDGVMSEIAITVGEAAKDFLGVLDRVERERESAVLLRNGQPVATLSPLPCSAPNCSELARRWSSLCQLPADEANAFADDIECARSSLRPVSGAMPRTHLGGFGEPWFDDRTARFTDCRHGSCPGSRSRHAQCPRVPAHRWTSSCGRDAVSALLSKLHPADNGPKLALLHARGDAATGPWRPENSRRGKNASG
jgi:hypothetical protein